MSNGPILRKKWGKWALFPKMNVFEKKKYEENERFFRKSGKMWKN